MQIYTHFQQLVLSRSLQLLVSGPDFSCVFFHWNFPALISGFRDFQMQLRCLAGPSSSLLAHLALGLAPQTKPFYCKILLVANYDI